MFKIHMGVPEMKEFWASLKETVKTGKASKNDERMYKRIGKTLRFISVNPQHPGLQTHEYPIFLSPSSIQYLSVS
jgi:hypothetical protein